MDRYEAALNVIESSLRYTKGGSERLFTFAESCTGGMAASAVASVPGASDFFPGGAITYSNDVKIEMLNVVPETIETFGAVSGECAAEMARGALEVFRTKLAVSITGIAGPSGAVPGKPVGTVWFAVARYDGRLRLKKMIYASESRLYIQERAAATALFMLDDELILMREDGR